MTELAFRMTFVAERAEKPSELIFYMLYFVNVRPISVPWKKDWKSIIPKSMPSSDREKERLKLALHH